MKNFLFILISILSLGFFFLRTFGERLPYVNIFLPFILYALILFIIICGALLLRYFLVRKIWISILFFIIAYFLSQQKILFYPYVLAGILFLPSVSLEWLSTDFSRYVQSCIKFAHQHFWPSLAGATSLLVLGLYRDAWSLYFQGDEWYWFKRYAPLVSSKWWPIEGILDIFRTHEVLGFHMSPVANSIYIAQFHLFHLHFTPYIAFSLATHILTSLAVGWLIYILHRRKLFAMVATFFFASVSTHQQAVTWVAATVNTQLSTLFGVLSLCYLLVYKEQPRRAFLIRSFLCIAIALFSKETAVAFLLIYLWLYWNTFSISRGSFISRQLQRIKEIWGVVISLFLFVVIRLDWKNFSLKNFSSATTASTQTIAERWQSFLIQTHIDLTFYRFFLFSLKCFSQAVIPSHLLMSWAAWITDIQFPYFNTEKAVRGTNYLQFIQTAAPEFLSYFLTIILVLLIVQLIQPKYRKTMWLGFAIFLAGIIPILGNTIKFPWWGTVSIIDSRHFYHLNVGMTILFTLLVISLARYLQRKLSLSQRGAVTLLLIPWLFFQQQWITDQVLPLKEQAIERKGIINQLYSSIPQPPTKMIIYTTSNKSYYGFAYWMLPFQTAFAHMLPTLFGKAYFAHGQPYPVQFYSEEYMPVGGLATQGYEEKDGYGIGYFLEKVPLIKVLEKYHYSPDMVFAFAYDGNSFELKDTTAQLRTELRQLLDSRAEIRSWGRYGASAEFFSFGASPSWSVIKQNNQYEVRDEKNSLIVTIELLPNSLQEQFSLFVGKQLSHGKPVGTSYLTIVQPVYLDEKRLIYSPMNSPTTWYLVAGNNLYFYRMEIYQKEKADLLIRTLEFVDQPNEEITRP